MALLTRKDQERVRFLVEQMIGNQGVNESGFRLIFNNVEKCMVGASSGSLSAYLQKAMNDDLEFANLISAMTIHHTAWFRELQHYQFLEKYFGGLKENAEKPVILKILCAACSTGEEVYSLAFLMESLKDLGIIKGYHISALDIDPVSIAIASKGRYKSRNLDRIPFRFRKYVHVSEEEPGFFVVEQLIRENISFSTANLLSRQSLTSAKNDLIFCRNLFIYLSKTQSKYLLEKIKKSMNPQGLLFTGLSEHIDSFEHGFISLDHSVHRLKSDNLPNQEGQDYTMRQVTAVKSLRQLLPLDAILVGASTGGFEALKTLLSGLNKDDNLPPVLVVQHIADEYLASFASRLATAVGLHAREPFDFCPLQKGSIYMAHDGYHLCVRESFDQLAIKIDRSDPVKGHRPGINKLFSSAAKLSSYKFAAFLLTGMGDDGAEGLLDLKDAGSFTAVQDRYSSVVFGMPKAALSIKAVCYMGNINSLNQISQEITRKSET